jgi:putative endonuclease
LADRKRLGRWGEKRCEKFLKRKGLKTLTRNFSCKTGEIDLVMVDLSGFAGKTGEIDLVMVDADRTIVFVEVKTRADESFGPSESAITAGKKTKMIRTARYFLATNEIQDRPLRFDVVTIILGKKSPVQVRHYENAFVP